MIHILLLMSHFSMLFVFVTGDIILSTTVSKGQFQLTCEQSGWLTDKRMEWYRTDKLVLETRWKSLTPSIKYLKHGSDLSNRTSVLQSPTKDEQSIVVKIDGCDSDRYWLCCGGYWCFWYCREQCSDSVFVKVTAGPTTTHVSEMSPTTPNQTPGMDTFVPLNGTLTLYSSMDRVTVDQLVTLSCTINDEIEKEKWIVFWAKNNSLILITSANSSIINPENLTDWLPSFLSANIDVGIQSFEDELQNVTVISSAFEQNITFPAPPSLIGQSFWNCGNLLLNNISNAVAINVIPQSTASSTSGPSVNTAPFVTSHQTVPVSDDPHGVVASGQKDDEPTSSTPIIAGSVGAAVVVGLVVILVLVWRRRKKNYAENRSKSGTTDTVREDIVMEANILYAGNKDNIREKSEYDDERVMQDNMLYAGTKDNIHENMDYHDDETAVMEDNVLYARSNGHITLEDGQINDTE